jgi:hypothetical protein
MSLQWACHYMLVSGSRRAASVPVPTQSAPFYDMSGLDAPQTPLATRAPPARPFTTTSLGPPVTPPTPTNASLVNATAMRAGLFSFFYASIAHLPSCVYNAAIDPNPMSRVLGGGGSCVGCGSNTAGHQCESCVAGFYRVTGMHLLTDGACRSFCKVLLCQIPTDANLAHAMLLVPSQPPSARP